MVKVDEIVFLEGKKGRVVGIHKASYDSWHETPSGKEIYIAKGTKYVGVSVPPFRSNTRKIYSVKARMLSKVA